MPTHLLTHRRLLIAAIGLLFVNTLLPTWLATKAGYYPRAIMTKVTAPLTMRLHALSTALRGGQATPVATGSVKDLQQRLGMLKKKNAQLDYKLDQARKQIRMLTQSRQIALSGVRLVGARVSSYSHSNVNPMLTLDRGTHGGIHADQAVVSGFSLAGRVDAAYPGTADVELISAKSTRLQVRIVPARDDAGPRELEEMIKKRPKGSGYGVRVSTHARVEVGDLAHLADPRWPPDANGFIVGRVSTVKKDPDNPLRFKNVIIQPLIPLDSLTRVTVMVPVE